MLDGRRLTAFLTREDNMLFKSIAPILTLPVAALALAACGDSGGSKSDTPPPPFAQDTYGNCAWEHVKGEEVGIWSYFCGPDAGNVRLVADATLPGFTVIRMEDRGYTKMPVIRIFKKGSWSSISAVIDDVRAASPGPHTDKCTLKQHPNDKTKYVLTPDAAAAAEWEKYQTSGEGAVQPPCGPMGPQFVGDNYFKVLDGDSTTVVFVDLGSEIPIFDAKSLHKLKK
jgi:hypothetical protein